MVPNFNLRLAIMSSLTAGKRIMQIYEEEDFQVVGKDDKSPLTIADKESNKIINDGLIPTGIPIISEENDEIHFEERKNWKECWIVDPLDGTKEFIKRNGEFTVNIALVESGIPQAGVIYAPALHLLYYADVSEGKAFKVYVAEANVEITDILETSQEIHPDLMVNKLKVVGSRSHMNDETLKYIEELKKKFEKEVEVVSKGSSLKFCLVAEGEAHVYPRFAPTMEWDTAAGQAICEAVGLKCLVRNTGEPMTYNRQNLLNDHFIVLHEE